MRKNVIARPLLRWWAGHRRPMPWNFPPSAYPIWVAVAMLQQTQVATVLPYFRRFMRRFPSIKALASASEHDVLRFWAGLGYYSRARNLRKAARTVMEQFRGRFPREREAMRSLPGIGAYAAAAIASIAFQEPVASVDGNFYRVLTRLYGLRGDPTRAPLKQRIEALANELIDRRRPGDFNQALMDLGAMVCVPRGPLCGECPFRSFCVARKKEWQERLPELPGREKAEEREKVMAVLLRRGRVFIHHKKEGKPRGMWGFPEAETRTGLEAATLRKRFGIRPGERIAEFFHTVTRYRFRVRAYLCRAGRSARLPRGGKWVSVKGSKDYPLGAADRRIADVLKKSHTEP